MKKKITSILLVLAMILSLGAILTSCGGDDTGSAGGNGGTTNTTAASYVNLDINPEISLTVNSEGVVLSAVGENEDAIVLLYGESGIVGAQLDAAVQRIVDLAVELGYLTEDNKVIETLVSTASGDAKALLDTIKASVNEQATAHGITFSVDTEGARSLIRRLEELKAEYPTDERIAALSVADYKLALKASENGEITFEEAIALERSELLERVGRAAEKIEQYSTKAFKQAREAALAIYERALDAAMAGVYTSYFTSSGKLTMLPKGALYQAYATAATGIESIAEALDLLEEVSEYKLDEAEVTEIVTALGLDETAVEAMKNADGDITLESIEDYVDVYVKNHKDENIEEYLEELDEILDTYEDKLEENAKSLAAEYSDEITAVMTALENAVNSIRAFVAETELAAFDKAVADIEAMIENGTVTEDALEDVAEDLLDAAEAVEDGIKATLTEDELLDVKELRDTILLGLESVKAQAEAALAQAELDAQTAIEAMKAARYGDK